jgi:hemerythrin-like domain-containing protein
MKDNGNSSPIRDPIDILKHEHEECQRHLLRMRNAAEYIRANGFSLEAYTQIAEAIRFIDTVMRQHDEKEEKYLFALLEKHGTTSPKILRNEHRELWIAFRHLLRTVEDIEEGRLHGTSVIDLVQLAKNVVDNLSSHIAKENEEVFPMARKVLTGEEYQQLKVQLADLPLLAP